ncbi:hypothetical protein JW935_28650 [candidate division KSB1 bacterium]|nr:hypothetical protein [candidate division KSB1 bacterium]
MRGDEQEPDTRRGTSGRSGYKVLHPQWDVLYKSGVYASTVIRSPWVIPQGDQVVIFMSV